MTATMIQVARPRLPDASLVLPYLQEIDRNQWYANHGPLARRLQARLAEHWGLAGGEVALVASGTAGLTLALRASGVTPGRRCLMPAWTFVASAGAVVAAGLVPHFIDVRPDTWAPDPEAVRALAQQGDVGAILVVSPFGAPLDMHAWEEVQRSTAVPVVIDAAAAFDTLRDGGPMQAGLCPTIVSLHATKVFGIGEGGAVAAKDPAFMARLRALAQFGFAGTREAMLPGCNGKLSEHTAAVGLAGLDRWPATRAMWKQITKRYAAMLPPDLARSPDFGGDWVSSTLSVLWPHARDGLSEALAAEGVGTLRWWGGGCHTHPAYRDCPREALPVTDWMAARAIGIPFWPELQPAQISKVCRAVSRVLARDGRVNAVSREVEAA